MTFHDWLTGWGLVYLTGFTAIACAYILATRKDRWNR